MNTLIYIFAGITAVSVVGILWTRNLLYAAFLLVLTFLGAAALFVLAGAAYVAVSQILIYVGGILILLVFGIMLTNRIAGQQVLSGIGRVFSGFLLSVSCFMAISFAITGFDARTATQQAIPNFGFSELGLALLTNYLLIFEIVGVLLLIALVGASTIARFKDPAG